MIFLNTFKSRTFAIENLHQISAPELTLEAAPESTKKSSVGWYKKCLNTIVNDEKDVNTEMFREYFKYQNPLFLKKYLYNAHQIKNESIWEPIGYVFLDLINDVIEEIKF